MSASLVGSEMCIRDRGRLRHRETALSRALNLGRRARPRGSELGAGGAAPVSYTHLTLPTICSV
eukprot:11102806-Alexandrium_andersonii.AAC.1